MLRLPTQFEEVNLGNPVNERRVREVIAQCSEGVLVLLSDAHTGGTTKYLATVRRIPGDNECFMAYLPTSEKRLSEKRLHYHDITSVMTGNPKRTI